MAEVIIEGTNLGYTEKPYDFTDRQTGEHVTGVSQRLHVLSGLDKYELKVPDALIGTVRALAVGQPVAIKVGLPKNVRLDLLDAEAS